MFLKFATDHLTRVLFIQYSVDMLGQAGYSDIIITGDMNSDSNTRDGHNLLNCVNANKIYVCPYK